MSNSVERSNLEDEPFNDSENESEETGLPSFDIGLSIGGDSDSSFRTENDPNAPYQRSNYIERKGAVDIRCSCKDVIHGSFSSESDTFATLIVLEFRFDARKRARRFHSADISLEFSAIEKGDSAPEVFGIAPNGKFSLAPTTQHEETKRGVSGDIGAGFGGPEVKGGVSWEKTVSRDTKDKTTIIGSIDLKGRNWGKPNCASWTLMENETTKDGVPPFLRTAILLKRKDENPFQCVVKIDASVNFDLKSKLERVFGGKGRVPKDDPVLFDPELEPTNVLQKYDAEELGALDLESLCDVTFETILGGAIKQK